jgi:hypothetical protein
MRSADAVDQYARRTQLLEAAWRSYSLAARVIDDIALDPTRCD